MTLRSYTVTDAGQFAALAPLWAELAMQGGRTSPFLSHDWFSCCWRAVQPDRRPEVLVVADGQNPVGLIPLMGWTQPLHGLPVRCLGLLEAPDSPEIDILAVAEPRAVLAAFLDHLAGRSDWDMIHIQKLGATSPTLKALEDALAGRFLWDRSTPLLSPYLTVTGDWESFFRGRTQRFRKTCRSVQNRLERAGTVSVEEHCGLDPSSPVFREMVDLSRRSWKADRGVAIPTMPRMLPFFEELTRCATRHGWLSLWLLKLDGRAIAMEYQIQSAGTVYALRADYDEDFASLSPGSALNHAIVRSLFERGGIHEYDMGPGANDYKLRWASGSHERVRLRLYHPRLYSRLLRALDGVVLPALRAVRGRFR